MPRQPARNNRPPPPAAQQRQWFNRSGVGPVPRTLAEDAQHRPPTPDSSISPPPSPPPPTPDPPAPTAATDRWPSTMSAMSMLNRAVNWQCGPEDTSPAEHFNHRLQCAYLYNARHADVYFRLSCGIKIPAHSLILRAASRQLESFCDGSPDVAGAFSDSENSDVSDDDDDDPDDLIVRQSDTDEEVAWKRFYARCQRIRVTKTPLADFNHILSHLYSMRELDIGRHITEANMHQLARCAQRFGLAGVMAQCGRTMMRFIHRGNVCQSYAVMRTLDASAKEHALRFMAKWLDELLWNGTLAVLSCAELLELMAEVERTRDPPKAMLLAEALMYRCDRQLRHEENNLAPSGAERRRRMEPAVFALLPFARMSLAQFSNVLRRFDVSFLTDAEVGAIVEGIVRSKEPVEYAELETVIGCACGKDGVEDVFVGGGCKKKQRPNGKCCFEANMFNYSMFREVF